ncbi:hypothetical protein [Ureibacillus sp. FSL E2-3493]|uniref:hypothetical protein n=1 Tax=Ureibacillus sp. FSL E2-3493 TaxID=2921367 RepID=UPI003119B019
MTEIKKVEVKTMPYECDGKWVGVEHAALTVYTLHPEFRGNTLLVYTYLLKNYNREKGYSYPSFDDMQLQLNLSRDVISDSIRTLRKLEMITIFKRGRNNHHAYTFNKLIEDEVEFITRFKDAVPNYEKKQALKNVMEQKKAEFDSLTPVK